MGKDHEAQLMTGLVTLDGTVRDWEEEGKRQAKA